MSKKIFLSFLFVLGILSGRFDVKADNSNYLNNRYPLIRKPYMELPLGSIKAKGWLLEMLERQRDGASSQMDTLYPEVMGERNGWLGGDGDQWERGPYWIDGLLPLAYILDDDNLKRKIQPWIEWTLKSQREDGFFGPSKDYSPEPGLQDVMSGILIEGQKTVQNGVEVYDFTYINWFWIGAALLSVVFALLVWNAGEKRSEIN